MGFGFGLLRIAAAKGGGERKIGPYIYAPHNVHHVGTYQLARDPAWKYEQGGREGREIQSCVLLATSTLVVLYLSY